MSVDLTPTNVNTSPVPARWVRVPGLGVLRPVPDVVAAPDGVAASSGPQPVGLSTFHISPPATDSLSADAVDLAKYRRIAHERLEELRSFDADKRVSKAQKFGIQIPHNGGHVKVTGVQLHPGPIPNRDGTCISKFTRASRRRALIRLNCIDRLSLPCLPIFVTLTYPGVYETDPKKWKIHLDRFFKRLWRRAPDGFSFWKLEPQKRGAPHFHLLVFGIPYLDKDWLSQAWYECVGSGIENHLRAGTKIERVRSWNGVNAYASKYLGKVPEGVDWPEGVGRWWGISNRKNCKQFIKIHEEVLPEETFNQIKRQLVRFLHRKGVRIRPSHTLGVSAFINAEVGLRLLHYHKMPIGPYSPVGVP